MAGQLTIDTLKASSGVLATQNGMTGICKAWVQFSATGGTITINGFFNISSVTRQGQGLYTITFTTAMANANYATVIGNSASPGQSDSNSEIYTTTGSNVTAPTTSAFVVCNKVAYSGGFWDPAYMTAVVVGN